MQDNVAKKIVLEFLSFIRYKIKNDLLTMQEIESIAKMLEQNLDISGTVDDLAKFYGVSEHQVRNNISRKLLSKPKRRVYYRFLDFMKIAPEKWRK